MLKKEQIKLINDNKGLFYFISDLLEEFQKSGEREMKIVFKNGKVKRKSKTTIG